MQHDQSDCAAAVVSTVLLSYKKELSIMKIRETIGTDMYGTTVSGIVTGLEKLHFTVKAVRVGIEELSPKLTFPAGKTASTMYSVLADESSPKTMA